MDISLKQKIGFGSAIIAALYLLADVVLDLLFEFLDLAFEAVEYVFDVIIEHLFDTSRHTAQTITFYLLSLIAAYVLYRLSRRLPGWYERLKSEWDETRDQFNETWDYWHTASVISRVKWGSAITLGLSMLMWGLLV
ncbi:MAG: hypothetical protein ACR65R_06485 [Methylomicrobium sp.]